MDIVQYYFMLLIALILIISAVAYERFINSLSKIETANARAHQPPRTTVASTNKKKMFDVVTKPYKLKHPDNPDSVILRNYLYPTPRIFSSYEDAFPRERFVQILSTYSMLADWLKDYDTRPPGPIYFSDALFWKVLRFLSALHTPS